MGRSAKDIFLDALDLRPGDRGPFVEGECAGDAGLRGEVERLLASHGRAGEFLGDPTAVADGRGGGTTPPAAPGGWGDGEPGGRIGPYKLLQQIGEGGFGVVFMAEQERPVQRRVALKIVKLGMDTRQVVARFDQERQALAMMDHPNIARVLDAGATPRGRPYFVMELVKGDAITDYCDRNHLTIGARLELFGQVCRAVQHAHTKGVIHRDLKPNNVLVSTHDGRAVAKVIDFGIAKATAARLTEKTLFTEFRQLVGTPQYMSPEQADGSLDIDTRTDVYSLGVLLYELITGLTPFDPERMRSAAYGEIQRIIREEEPAKPSTRLSQQAQTLATVAALRHTDPRALTRGVRGDLDWIVMKAMEKDRARRYETAEALAADVERHMKDEPVAAGRPGQVYRMRKLVRRNRGTFVAVAVVALALVVGSGAAVYGMVEAQRQRAAAVRSAQKLEQVQELFVGQVLGSADVYESGNENRTVLEAVSLAAQRAGQIADPEVRAAVEHEIGAVYLSLGRFGEARGELERALAVRKGLTTDEGRADAARTMFKLARALSMLHQPGPAEEMAGSARAIRAELFGPGSREVVEADLRLADIRYSAQRKPEAMEILDRAIETIGRLEPAGQESGLTASALATRGGFLSGMGQYGEALVVLERAAAILRRIDKEPTAELASVLVQMSHALAGNMRFPEAEAAEAEALAIRKKLLLPEHPLLAQSVQAMGAERFMKGQLDAAEKLEREALTMYERAYPSKDYPDGNESIALTQKTLARVLMERGAAEEPDSDEVEPVRDRAAVEEAAGYYRRAIATLTSMESRAGAGKGSARLANVRGEYGRCLMLLGRYPDAEGELLAAHDILSAVASKDRPAALEYIVDNLVKLYTKLQKPDKAAEWKSRRGSTGSP